MLIKEGKEKQYKAYVKLNSDDPYSNRIVTYGEHWARLMELHIEKHGELSKDVADKTSHQADTDGITGFMYGSSKQTLIHFWKYGRELESLLGSDNPALLVIEVK